MRRATQHGLHDPPIHDISIHALHEESDQRRDQQHGVLREISIHALHEESDINPSGDTGLTITFQSTLSMRRATGASGLMPSFSEFQSTLSMRRATRRPLHSQGQRREISIHALHEESDSHARPSLKNSTISIHALHEESDAIRSESVTFSIFQSTLSMRRATRRAKAARKAEEISIHALHEESDERLRVFKNVDPLFQSTLSMRRAT